MNEKNTLPVSDDDLDDAPIWTDEDFAHAVHRIGLKPVGKKQKVSIARDPDVVAHNAALREAMCNLKIAEPLRQVIREEQRQPA
jgi:hypothetical protein